MKQFEFKYPWTENDQWWMPSDEEMMQGQFPILDEQIDFVLEAIETQSPRCRRKKRTCIQAGGCFGMYPIRLAYHFEKVITFEPFEKNLQCLIRNINENTDPRIRERISVREFALYDTNTMLKMAYPRPLDRAVSNGAHHLTEERGDIPTTVLDFMEFEDLDLIWLDIEGSELRALIGAEETIKKHKPVVVIEERNLPQTKNYSTTARSWLESRGWTYYGKTHADAIFLPPQ